MNTTTLEFLVQGSEASPYTVIFTIDGAGTYKIHGAYENEGQATYCCPQDGRIIRVPYYHDFDSEEDSE